jgi:hypothetical protein
MKGYEDPVTTEDFVMYETMKLAADYCISSRVFKKGIEKPHFIRKVIWRGPPVGPICLSDIVNYYFLLKILFKSLQIIQIKWLINTFFFITSG